MKLSIKKKYFEQIKSGQKMFEFRDAHITFICEETGEQLTKKVLDASVSLRPYGLHSTLLTDEYMISFQLASD